MISPSLLSQFPLELLGSHGADERVRNYSSFSCEVVCILPTDLSLADQSVWGTEGATAAHRIYIFPYLAINAFPVSTIFINIRKIK